MRNSNAQNLDFKKSGKLTDAIGIGGFYLLRQPIWCNGSGILETGRL